MTRTLFTDVRLLEGSALTDPMTVAVEDGRIVSVKGADERTGERAGVEPPEGAGEIVDGRGRVLLPGLIDSHLHLSAEGDLAVLARHGVTTGLDMASWPASFTAGLRALDGPVADFRSAGVPFIGPRGPHSHFGMPDHAVVTDPADVPAGVARRLADGSDVLKVVTEPQGAGGPGWDVVRAVVKVAHDRGVRVVAHAAVFESFARCLEEGVDVITHVPMDRAVTAEMARQMADRGQIAVPTLTVAETFGRAMPREGAGYATARESVGALQAAGVTILAGTDSVEQEGMPFSVPLGAALHRELQLLVGAGLPVAQALAAATSAAAAHWGLEDRGEIRVGDRADLVLLADDPLGDIAATRSVQGVWVAGRHIG